MVTTEDTGRGILVTFADGDSYYQTMEGGQRATTCDACGTGTFEAEYRQRQEVRDPPYTLCGSCQRLLWFPGEEGGKRVTVH